MIDEVTLSHMLREPNEFMRSGLSYGSHLAMKLSKRKSFPEYPRILEIGIGLGDMAESFCSYLNEHGIKSRYVMMDICEDLLGKVRNYIEVKISGLVQADALNLPSRPKYFNIVLCNESAGDFSSVTIEKSSLKKHREGKFEDLNLSAEDMVVYKDAIRMINDYEFSFDDAPDEFVFDYGAVKFVEELARLKPRISFISENSCRNGYSEQLKLKTHTEQSINFGHIERAASMLGFKTEVGDIDEFFDIDTSKECIDCVFVHDFMDVVAGKRGYDYHKLRKIEDMLYIALTLKKFYSRLKEAGFVPEPVRDIVYESKASKPMAKNVNYVKYLILEHE